MFIQKIHLKNFKKFQDSIIYPNRDINILTGENGAGKSTILQAISLTLSGSSSKLDKLSLNSLMNIQTIKSYMEGSKQIESLPQTLIEIFFDEETEKDNFTLNGTKNSSKIECSGLKMVAQYDPSYGKEIQDILKNGNSFPFEYYKITFSTFAGKTYSSYNLQHKFRFAEIDTSKINTGYALKKFVRNLYIKQTDNDIRRKANHSFREIANTFSKELYSKYNFNKLDNGYELKININNEDDFVNQITAFKQNIPLNAIGQGEQVLVSIMATNNNDEVTPLLLLEEPENHLSHINMQRLIDYIKSASGKQQIFISTHNNMIASRLSISKIFALNNNQDLILKLDTIDEDTVKFFQKSTNTNLLNFLQSKSVILVEGNAEYILMEYFYFLINHEMPYNNNVSIISCNGKTFKRYLEIAKVINKKVAIITDNDEENKGKRGFVSVKENYKDYSSYNSIKVFTDSDPQNYTFEVSLYNNNKDFYEKVFKKDNLKNYLLKNKTEVALTLLQILKKNNSITIPSYICEALKWIRS